MTIPFISALHVYPVKSLHGTDTGQAVVEPWGLAGDRRWMLVDAAARTVVTQREQPSLTRVLARLAPEGTPGVVLTVPGREPLHVAPPAGPPETVRLFAEKVDAVPAGEAADALLSEWLGTPVRLVHLDEPGERRLLGPEFALPGATVSFADEAPLLLTASSSLDALNCLVAAGDRAAEGPLPMSRFRPSVVVDGTEP